MSKSYVAIPIEHIGTCEWCGATDHHLVEGVCATCRPKAKTVDALATSCGAKLRDPDQVGAFRRMIESATRALRFFDMVDETPLGAEADVSHVRRPKGTR